MIKLIILAIVLIVSLVPGESYRPRGWRPDGPSFDPASYQFQRLQTYNSPPQSYYGATVNRPTYPQQTVPTTTESTTTSEPSTTTTTKTREQTTPTSDISDEDFETSPALAIANSFAFNRPVYVYNTYPFHSGLTFV